VGNTEDAKGGFKYQLQQSMFGSRFGEFHVHQKFAVNHYWRSKSERLPRARIQTPGNFIELTPADHVVLGMCVSARKHMHNSR
jgi:hypothetical protein